VCASVIGKSDAGLETFGSAKKTLYSWWARKSLVELELHTIVIESFRLVIGPCAAE
jgi:hypothetical protein